EVRDLWPESLEAVGVSGGKAIVTRAPRKIAGLLYRRADHILVGTHAFKKNPQRGGGGATGKNSGVVNWGDDQKVHPQTGPGSIVGEFGLQDKFVVGYIGTIGNAHGVETLATLADLLKISDPEVLFLVVGEGAEREKLVQLAAGKNLTNLKVFPGQPRERIP